MDTLITYFHTLWATTWAENSLAGKIIVALIMFLLFRSLVCSRRHLRRYRRENDNLLRAISLLKQVQSAPPDAILNPKPWLSKRHAPLRCPCP
jgi:hypothetical protein